MSDILKFRYYYGEEADQFTFYRIPKLLIIDSRFNGISSDAKILYGIMLDRMSLSMKNGWYDAENRVFIYFSVEDTMEMLNVGKNKALKTLAELDDDGGIGLIERIKQGQGKATRVYVKKFISDTETTENSDLEVYNVNTQKFEIQTPRNPQNKLLEVCNSNPNDTYISDTYSNKTKCSLSSLIDSDCGSTDYEKIILENLQIDVLLKRNPLDADIIHEMVALIVECLNAQNETMVIASNKYPTRFVRNKFLKLTLEHIEYALRCFKNNTTKVKNIKKYLLATLFNAPSTIDSYYRAEVNHDMPEIVLMNREA